MRETLALLIDAQPDMEMVGAAASGHEAVRRATELQPDIVLMDIHMPDLDGIQATWLVSNRAPHGAVIMVSRPTTQSRFTRTDARPSQRTC